MSERLDGEVRRTAPGSKYRVDHRHAGVEFDLVVRGTGTFTLDEHVYELKPGTLIWLPPGRRHRLARTPKLEMWVVVARTELMEPDWLASIEAQPSRIIAGEELIDLDKLLSQVAQDSDDPHTYNAGIRYALMRAWRASSDRPPADIRPMHAAVSRALLVLREHGAALSLSELAEETGIAAPYLSRLLVDNTGHSFLEWRNHIRLDRFLAEYRPGGNLLSLALDSGFGSYSRFHHVFIELMGCTPSDWVRQTEDGGNGGGHRPAAAESFSLPHAAVVSSRQRWARLVPVVSPTATALLGPGFLELALSMPPEAPPSALAAYGDLDHRLPEDARSAFLADLAARDQEAAREFGEMLEKHDFPGIFERVLSEYGLSPQLLPHAVAGMAAALWTTIHQASDPAAEAMLALGHQMTAALDVHRPRPPTAIAQAAHTALICHSTVVYHALQGARARADERATARLVEAASASAKEMFGHDLKRIALTARGFTPAP